MWFKQFIPYYHESKEYDASWQKICFSFFSLTVGFLCYETNSYNIAWKPMPFCVLFNVDYLVTRWCLLTFLPRASILDFAQMHMRTKLTQQVICSRHVWLIIMSSSLHLKLLIKNACDSSFNVNTVLSSVSISWYLVRLKSSTKWFGTNCQHRHLREINIY